METRTRRSENLQRWRHPESARLNGGVLRRSTILALIIGSALTWINQSAAITGSKNIQLLPMFLAYATPFTVIAISQLTAIRRAWQDATRERLPETTESLVASAFLHGIPARALTIGLIVGTVNSAFILSEAFLNTGDIGAASATLLAQVYSLPVLFGFLSQAVSYRRAARVFAD